MISFLARHLFGRGAAAAASCAAETAAASAVAAEAAAASTVAAESTLAVSAVAAGGALTAVVPIINVAIAAYTTYKIFDLITSRMDACRITVCENQVATLEMGKYRR